MPSNEVKVAWNSSSSRTSTATSPPWLASPDLATAEDDLGDNLTVCGRPQLQGHLTGVDSRRFEIVGERKARDKCLRRETIRQLAPRETGGAVCRPRTRFVILTPHKPWRERPRPARACLALARNRGRSRHGLSVRDHVLSCSPIERRMRRPLTTICVDVKAAICDQIRALTC